MLKKTNATIALAMALFIQGCGSGTKAPQENPSDAAVDASGSDGDGHTSSSSAATPILGQCHMEECVWTIPMKQYQISKSVRYGGKTTKFDIQVEETKRGFSTHSGEAYPSQHDSNIRISWDNKIAKSYYICDKIGPAVIDNGTIEYLNPYKQYGYSLDTMHSYFRVCEKNNIDINLISGDSPEYQKLLREIGFDPNSIWWDTAQVRTRSLEDALKAYLENVRDQFGSE